MKRCFFLVSSYKTICKIKIKERKIKLTIICNSIKKDSAKIRANKPESKLSVVIKFGFTRIKNGEMIKAKNL